jgi:hypothetical protein
MAPVITLACEGIAQTEEDDEGELYEEEMEGVFILSEVGHLPPSLAAFLSTRYPLYFLDHCQGPEAPEEPFPRSYSYYMNHCACGAKFEDFYLHNEPGGAFFPTDEQACERMTLFHLAGVESFALSCGFGTGPDDLIARCVPREETDTGF